jgi:hypothetical protein
MLGVSYMLDYAAGTLPASSHANKSWLSKVGGSTFYFFFHFTGALDGQRLSTNFEVVGAGTLQPQCDLSART